MSTTTVRNERGAALFMTLLVSIAISGIALGGILLASGAQLSTRYNAKEVQLQASADGGLEVIRDSLNRGVFDTLLPLAGFTTLASGVSVKDAYGATLPRITQSLYVGRTGGRTGGAATAGQYGSNFASALSVISDARGAVAVRRMLLTQESWSKFAVAINNWSGAAAYGCGESVNGPFFSNSGLIIQGGCSSPKTLFAGPASVVGSVTNAGSANFTQGLKTGVTPIQWPTPARIGLMRQYAQEADAANGDYDLTSRTIGSKTPGLRIEFVTIDANGNGVIDWDEGYMRVWVPANTSDSVLAYATGRRWPHNGAGANLDNSIGNVDPNQVSMNCGAVRALRSVDSTSVDSTYFHSASQAYNTNTGSAATKLDSARALLLRTNHRCYLGGDPILFHRTTGDTLTPDSTVTNLPLATNNFGWWQKRRSGPWAAVSTKRSGDKAYLIPLGSNPNFKGVVFVQGDVALSGRLRGRVSVFATGNIILADDLLYQNPPGTKCDAQGDIFGAIATKDVIIEDNNLQTPFPISNVGGAASNVYGGFDDTSDANYNLFFLAAGDATGTTGNWYGEGASPGAAYPQWLRWGTGTGGGAGTFAASAVGQRCGDPSSGASNGCIRITGGLGEGRVDNWTYYPADFGWAEAHTYDACGAVNPPPYFPTTGRFIPSRYYEIDPVWLNSIGIASYFTRLQSQ